MKIHKLDFYRNIIIDNLLQAQRIASEKGDIDGAIKASVHLIKLVKCFKNELIEAGAESDK